MKKEKLTEKMLLKYKAVVDKWFTVKFNGAEAWRFYYPNVKKDSTATVNFSRIQNLPEVKEYILEKHEEARKKIGMTHEGILEFLKLWIESDITETIGLSPSEVKRLPIELKRLVNKFKETIYSNYDKKTGALLSKVKTIELSFISKEKAIEMINKHIGFYEIDNKQKAPVLNYDNVSDAALLELFNARKKEI